MKQFLLILAIVIASVILSAVILNAQGLTEPYFVEVAGGKTYKIVYDCDTKVMYAISDSMYSRGNFTLLVNPDGSPRIYEE